MTIAVPLSPADAQRNTPAAIRPRITVGRITWARTLAVLLFRTAAFLTVQALIAALFAMRGDPAPWQSSIAYWPVSAMVTGALNLALLIRLTASEGLRYIDLLSLSRHTVGRDILVVLGLLLLAGPLTMVPMMGLSTLLFGDAEAASAMFVRSLPLPLAAVSIVLLPLSIALVELPTYFGYVMPRLEALGNRAWLAVGMASLFLALQHITLPLLFDWRFIAWRALMFMPFAFLLGIVLHWRPRLMPYLMAVHFLLDMATAWFVWVASAAAR